MARTKNPHLAAIKSWETRRKGAKGDYGPAVASVKMGQPILLTPGVVMGHTLTPPQSANQKAAAVALGNALRVYEIPEMALDGMSGIMLLPDYAMSTGPAHIVVGKFSGETRRAAVNFERAYKDARDTTFLSRGSEKSRLIEKRVGEDLAKTAAHEIGHNAYLVKLTDEAAWEWYQLSKNGENARISDYARTSVSEHFSEAFAAYACPDTFANPFFSRDELKRREPKAYAFMEKLFRTESMWLPRGKGEYAKIRKDWV